jgi:hypothetical protein
MDILDILVHKMGKHLLINQHTIHNVKIVKWQITFKYLTHHPKRILFAEPNRQQSSGDAIHSLSIPNVRVSVGIRKKNSREGVFHSCAFEMDFVGERAVEVSGYLPAEVGLLAVDLF